MTPAVANVILRDSPRYMLLSGVSGNYANTPDSAPLSVVGDIDLRCQVALNDWATSANQTFIAKDDVATNRDYAFFTHVASGMLRFFYSTDGSTLTGRIATSSVGTGFTNFTTNWVRVTYATATGAVNFYTSQDGANWKMLGVEQTITSGAIHNGTTALGIGAGSAGASLLTGRIYRAQVYDGIAGTLVHDADFTTQMVGTLSFRESSSNRAVVTVNQSGSNPARIVS